MTDTELVPPIGSATAEAAARGREVARVAGSWTVGWTLLPFLVGGLEAERSPSLGLLVGAVYITGPLAMLLHGAPAAMSGPAGGRWLLLAGSAVGLLLLLAVTGDARAAVALALAGGVAIADASPAARTADRPFIAVFSRAVIVALTTTGGLLLGGRTVTDVDWAVVVAVGAWTAGSMAVRVLAAGVDDHAPPTDDGPDTAPERAPSGLSARLLTWVAAAGYAVAVVLALTLGPTGILAAVGIATYLLLPAMVRSARGDGAEAIRRAARRAWDERPALDALVGPWLAILVLVHWGILRPDPWTVAVVGATALTGYLLADIVVGRVATRRRRVRPRTSVASGDPDSDRALAIVVPCLDRAASLPGTLAALRAQTYPDTTVVVVDAGSVDGSSDEAAAWLGEDAVVVADPPPPGWTRLDWARDTGVRATEGELVLFVGADTVLAPIAARILVEQLDAGGLDAISGRPRQVMSTSAARIAGPGFSLAWFGLRPGWVPALFRGRPARLTVADPSLLLVRRDAYAATGLAAVPRGALPGIGLARTMVRRGYRFGTLDAATLAASRGMDDLTASLDVWRRATMRVVGRRLAGAIALVALEIGALVVPLLLPFVALASGAPPALVGMACLPLVVLAIARVVLTLTEREPFGSILWHPVTVAATIAGQLAAIGDHVRGGRMRPVRHAPPPSAEVGDA